MTCAWSASQSKNLLGGSTRAMLVAVCVCDQCRRRRALRLSFPIGADRDRGSTEAEVSVHKELWTKSRLMYWSFWWLTPPVLLIINLGSPLWGVGFLGIKNDCVRTRPDKLCKWLAYVINHTLFACYWWDAKRVAGLTYWLSHNMIMALPSLWHKAWLALRQDNSLEVFWILCSCRFWY